jgi:TonB family protein
MFRRIGLLICLSLLAFTAQAQTAATKDATATVATAAAASDRESDGLFGPVRRVVVESAKIVLTNGEPAESNRAVRAITTYDQVGHRVDNVAYPIEGTTPPGKQQYKYDDKGNIVEMQVRADDGSILSRETYKYVFDELGNWKKMTTSLAVFENGKLGEEPVEVTYRAITYFYSQEVAKLTVGDGNTNALPPETKPEISTPPPIPTKRVSEDVLRKAAISLPQPEYPRAAELSRSQGRVTVEVIVDEKGSVTHARASSDNPLLSEAAEVAARSARFQPSPDPARITGVLTYDFVLPTAATEMKAAEVKTVSERPIVTNAAADSTPAALSLFKLGEADLTAGNLASAADFLKQSVDKDPEYVPAYMKLGIAYTGLRRYKDAVAVIKMAIQIKPDLVDAETYFHLGNSYEGLGKHEDALKAFKQSLYVARAETIIPELQSSHRTPSPQELHYSIGLAYNNLGKYTDAIKELKQVITINPQLAEAYYGLAVCYIATGDRRSAEKQQKILAGLNPDLANKIGQALSDNRNLPPGLSEGMLNGSRRH